MLQGVTECHRVSQCHRVLHSIKEYNRILQSISEYHRVLQSITKYFKVLQIITEYYRVLHSITKYYKVLKSIKKTKTNLAHLLGPIFGLVKVDFLIQEDVTSHQYELLVVFVFRFDYNISSYLFVVEDKINHRYELVHDATGHPCMAMFSSLM